LNQNSINTDYGNSKDEKYAIVVLHIAVFVPAGSKKQNHHRTDKIKKKTKNLLHRTKKVGFRGQNRHWK